MKRLLVVDDEEIIRDVMQDIVGMNWSNITVETACSGEEALGMLQANKFDLIFLDMKMKTVDGLETYRRIHEINPKQKVFIITGYFDMEKTNLAITEGVCGTLYKPFTMEQIVEIIDKYVVGSRASRRV